MQTASCTLRNLVPVLCDNIDQSTAYGSEAGDEKVYVLSASLVKELIVDGSDGDFGIL